MLLVIKLSKKKNNNKQSKFPFFNEIKKMKNSFKKMIDKMSDEEFLEMTLFLMTCSDGYDEDFDEDDEWEYQAEKFCYNRKNNIRNFPITENDNMPF